MQRNSVSFVTCALCRLKWPTTASDTFMHRVRHLWKFTCMRISSVLIPLKETHAPSHLRLRQAATLLKDSNRRSDVVLFSVTPAFTRANMDEEDHEPYHRLLYDMRSLFCSASYKVRHASANIEHRRLILPFGHWNPSWETTTGIAGGFPRVSYPYGWPVVICINGQCVLPLNCLV